MAVVKIGNKKVMEELQAKLMLRLGRKITQQETIDICIEVANAHFEEMIAKASEIPVLSPDKAEEIIQNFEKYRNTPYNPNAKFPNQNDQDIYSL
mgnify:CR=1 FL=1